MAGVCAEPGCPDWSERNGRCLAHARSVSRQQARTVPTKVARTYAVQKRRAEAVRRHRAVHGAWCPGWGVPAHEATDLTADDPVAIANGGDPMQPLQILCRSCNSRKGNRG